VPSVASQVTASITQHRDAKASASANGKDNNSPSPFEEMLDSAVAAEDPAPSAKDASPAKASNGNAAPEGKKTSSANGGPATDDATPAQASNLERDGAAGGESAEGNDAILGDLVGKALMSDAGAGAPSKSSEVLEEAAPAEKPIVEIGLAAFLEAVASATTPQPETKDAKDEPQKADGDAKADGDTPAAAVVTGPVKVEAIAAAVVTMTAEVNADPAQPDAAVARSGGNMTSAVGANPALPEAAASPPQQDAASKNLGEGIAADAAAADFEADALATQLETPKPHADTHKHRVETTAQHSEAPKLVAGASRSEAAPEVEPEAPAPHPSHVTHRHPETAEAKPAQPAVSPAEAPAPVKPVDAPQTLQTLQITAPALGAIQSPAIQKDATPVAMAVPIEGVAIEIAAKASEGMKSFEIRLDPPELGRIHVRLDVDRNGELTSRVTADRQDTLDLLRRDAPQLERALNDAGLRTSNNGLQFSLRDQGQGQQQHQQALPNAARLIIPDESLAAELTQRGYYRPAGSAGGIDIRV
jgi:flagellar hook-length control protein FliK